DRARRRLCVVEWIRLHPGCECRSILVAKAPLEKVRRFGFAIELGGKPTIKRIAIVDPFLACQGGEPFSSDAQPIGPWITPVRVCPPTLPPDNHFTPWQRRPEQGSMLL